MEYFSVYFNQIKSLHENTFAKSANLTKLRLSANQLESLSPKIFANCPNLSIVILTFNKLSQLHSDIFACNSNLTECNLSSNVLVSLEGKLFRNCKKLRKLELVSNKFNSFKSEWLLGAVSLEEIYIHNENTNQIEEFRRAISDYVLALAPIPQTHTPEYDD